MTMEGVTRTVKADLRGMKHLLMPKLKFLSFRVEGTVTWQLVNERDAI